MTETQGPGSSSGREERCCTPDRLQHGLEGWPPAGPNAFNWANQRLSFSIGGSHLSVVPTPEEWAEFWKSVMRSMCGRGRWRSVTRM